MPTSLTLLSNGATVSASTLQGYVNDIESFVNEDISASDLVAGSWVKSYHIFKPEFRGSPDPAATLVTGRTHYRRGGSGPAERSVHHWDLIGGTADTAYVPVRDMQAPLKVPGSSRGVKVLASFYTFEFGGDGTVDEATDLAARFAIKVGDTIQTTTFRDIYTTSINGDCGFIHARKQHTIAAYFTVLEGIQSLGVWVRVYEPATPATPEWRHIFVTDRSFVVDYYTL